MGSKFKRLFIGMFIIMIITPVTWYCLKLYWQNKAKMLYFEAKESFEKKYAYTLFYGELGQTIYTEKEDDGQKLLTYYRQMFDYYKKVESGEIKQKKRFFHLTGDSVDNVSFIVPVPLKYLGVPQEVYIKNKDINSSVTKVYVFNTYCWGYFEAYVPFFNLHDNLPNDTLFQELIKHNESLPRQSNDIFRRPSPYGFYCN